MSNETRSQAGTEPDNYWHNFAGGDDGYYSAGNITGSGLDGALRFPGVTGSGTCTEAQLFLYVDDAGGTGGKIELDVYGIDEDNTSLFTGDPMSRNKTTNIVEWNLDRPSVGIYANINVTSLVNEVRSRGGWSSGNALGIFFFADGTTSTDSWFSGGPEDVPPNGNPFSSLLIREVASPDTNPTPGTVPTPTFPDTTDYGIKISKTGQDVGTTAENDLHFTTRKKVVKVLEEGTVSLPDGLTTKAHNLGYVPMALAYVNTLGTSTRRFKFPRTYYATDPVGDGIEGSISTNGTNTFIYTEIGGSTATGYYYTFVDELP